MAHGYEDNVIFGHAKDGNIHFASERLGAVGWTGFDGVHRRMVDLVLGFDARSSSRPSTVPGG